MYCSRCIIPATHSVQAADSFQASFKLKIKKKTCNWLILEYQIKEENTIHFNGIIINKSKLDYGYSHSLG